MTKQQMFNKVVRHLKKQGRQSATGERCRYRYRGMKCAIGCLIPDSKYTASMEGVGLIVPKSSVDRSIIARRIRKAAGINDNPSLLKLARHLLWIHDCIEPNRWAEEFDRVRYRHHLKPVNALTKWLKESAA